MCVGNFSARNAFLAGAAFGGSRDDKKMPGFAGNTGTGYQGGKRP